MEIITDDRLDKFILSLGPDEKARCRRMIGFLQQFGPQIGNPHSKKIHSQLWELRIRGDVEI